METFSHAIGSNRTGDHRGAFEPLTGVLDGIKPTSEMDGVCDWIFASCPEKTSERACPPA
jgi:hypothetical protein